MTDPSSKYHHGNLKQALIEAGQLILIEKGLNGLSLRETAKAAGVSHTAPYRHFKDKEAPYKFMNVENLVADFLTDVATARRAKNEKED